MTHIAKTTYIAPCGELNIWTYADSVVMCKWAVGRCEMTERRILRSLRCDVVAEESEVAKELKAQLDEYFCGERKTFSTPTLLIGTDFQKAAWQALTQIPYGTTITYREEAALACHPGAMRAIGNCNNANPVVILIPCHRVVPAHGAYGGYNGGSEIKRHLIELEQGYAQEDA